MAISKSDMADMGNRRMVQSGRKTWFIFNVRAQEKRLAFGPNVLDLETILFFSHWLVRLCICLYWSINIEYWRDGVGEGISYLFFSEVVPKISLLSQFDCTEWTKWLIWVWFWSLRPLLPPTTSGSKVSFFLKQVFLPFPCHFLFQCDFHVPI